MALGDHIYVKKVTVQDPWVIELCDRVERLMTQTYHDNANGIGWRIGATEDSENEPEFDSDTKRRMYELVYRIRVEQEKK